MKRLIIIFICVSLTGIRSLTYSQDEEIKTRTYLTEFTKTPPEIDGRMDDSCWALVKWGGDFIQKHPYENKPPSQKTSFKILYDNNYLYAFIRAFDTEPDKISRILSRRDDFAGDFVQIIIDSDFDKNTAFAFTAMASGTKGDEAVSLNGNNWDESWNPVWYLKTSIDHKGWNAEMKIPLSQLRFGKKDEYIWGIELVRRIFRDDERSEWQYIPKGAPGYVHLFGELHGIKNIRPKRQVELLPYVVTRLDTYEKDEENPFATGRSLDLSAGIDGKIGITNDFILDFTVNPDFGQVEADPSEVNLTAFETYFSERRPFFVEGKNIYQFHPSDPIVFDDFGQDNLFYSRRIGRHPQYDEDLPDSVYAKIPDVTTILSALKLSGKTKKGLSVGVLESVTAHETAEIASGEERRKETAEPFTNYFVGSLRKDFNKGETILGGMLTAVNRDIRDTIMDDLHTDAYACGIDFQHNWKKRTWYIAANAVVSNVKGSEKALLNTQTSSARHFQRPDAKHLHVDSSLTSLNGYGASMKFGRHSEKRIQFETSLTLRSPGLEFNDIGYMRYADFIHHGTWMGYYIREPFSIFREFYLNLNYWMYWDYDGKLLSNAGNMNFFTQFKNKWGLNGSFTRRNKGLSRDLLRGGPSFVEPGMIEMNMNINSDQSKKVYFYLGNYHGYGDSKSFYSHYYWTGITLRPMNNVYLSFEPEFGIWNHHLQYIETVDFNDVKRYIFARIDQKTLKLVVRINYTITPNLTIQYYGQPFISTGKYTNMKRITDSHASAYEDRFHIFSGNEIAYNSDEEVFNIDENADGINDYSIDDPDFNSLQFQSNLVIRWEYLPGSTVYLVWSQAKIDSGSNGHFDFDNELRDMFRIYPHNVFLIKLNYWFSL